MKPAAWPSLPLKRVVDSVQSGTSVNGAPWPAQDDQAGVLKTSAVYGGVFTPTENKEVESYDLDRVSCPVLAGTLIVSRMNTPQHLGVAAAVRQDFPNLYLPDRLWAVTFSGAEPRFIDWWTKTAAYRAQVEAVSVGTSSSMQNISQGDFLEIRIELPDLETQRAVADYLDRETVRIDTLIEEQQRLIEMLRERRDSAWAARVEEARRLGRTLSVRRLIESIVDGPFGSSLTSAHYSDEGARVIRLGNIGVNEFKGDDAAFIPLDYAKELEAHAVEQGDVVVAGLGDDKMPLGRAAVVPPLGPAIVKADCYRLRPNEQVSAAYLAWAMSAPQTRSQIMLLARGSTRARLNTKVVQQVEVPLPDRTAQDALVAQSDVETRKIDRLVAEAECFIDLSRERRSALITAAVTGQIDVREMA